MADDNAEMTGESLLTHRAISSVVNRKISINDLKCVKHAPTVFHGVEIPSMTLDQYLDRYIIHGKTTEIHLVVAFIYLDRLTENHPDISLTSYTMHRLYSSALVIASKYASDNFYNNTFYARIGGLPTEELNHLEHEFLRLINFNLYVDPSTFHRYTNMILEKSKLFLRD